jgi:hypothetical protein
MRQIIAMGGGGFLSGLSRLGQMRAPTKCDGMDRDLLRARCPRFSLPQTAACERDEFPETERDPV